MAKRRHITVVTGTRAEYGLLDPAMHSIATRAKLSVVVGGMHLVTGTWRDVAFHIDAKVPMQRQGDVGHAADVAALGRGVSGFGKAFAKLKPDIVLILGDRIEAFAAASAASVGGLRLAHIHGGDRAEGVADEAMRHAISKLAHIHLPASAQSARRLVRMGEDPAMVFNVGSPAVSGLAEIEPTDDAVLRGLGVDPSKRFVVVMQHPSGGSTAQERKWMAATLQATRRLPRVVMGPNHDPGREGVVAAMRAGGIAPIGHLPRSQFIGLLKRASVLVGNSSAGLIEAAALKLATVNVGRRQNGREKPGNVIDAEPQEAAVREAVAKAMAMNLARLKQPYGDGQAHERIAQVLAEIDLDAAAVRKCNAY